VKFEDRLRDRGALIEARLDSAVRDLGDDALTQAMGYAVRGGKRLRGFLVMESASVFGISEADSVGPAAAIEALHAYSLVHDDLPSMDDDDLRRGQPTVHVKWDEATAILVGDALQTLAFELVTDTGLPDDRRVELALSLAYQAGARGMVRGQMLDIAAEGARAPLELDEITRLQSLKTGALMTWSAAAGALMAGEDTEPLAAYADALGLAFQIADDILDVAGDEAKTGKRLQKDALAGKATFVSLLGLEVARTRAAELVAAAEAALAPYGRKADGLREAARFAISRQS
jgi:farnesyl diphosphate synthase